MPLPIISVIQYGREFLAAARMSGLQGIVLTRDHGAKDKGSSHLHPVLLLRPWTFRVLVPLALSRCGRRHIRLFPFSRKLDGGGRRRVFEQVV